MKLLKNKKGFSLIEILIVVGIIAVLAISSLVVFSGVRQKARDTKRKHDLALIGRFLSTACYLPSAGAGEYDLADLVAELLIAKPQYKQYLKKTPMDPKSGTVIETNYFYIVTADGKHCALYANLENENEEITLQKLTEPTPGGGAGVLRGSNAGVNDTNIYYQYSSN